MNARTRARRKLDMLDGLEKARLARMQARDASARVFEAEHDALGELARPRAPAAVKRGDYVADRLLSKNAGAKKGWRKRTPLEAAFEKGMLGGEQEALARYEAGKFYAHVWRAAEGVGRDSTNMECVSGSGARDLPPGQMRALAHLAKLEAGLSLNDRRIVRAVCGLELRPSTVICAIHAGYRDKVSARLCEALDALAQVRA